MHLRKIYIAFIFFLTTLLVCEKGFAQSTVVDTICVGETYNKNGFNIPRQDVSGYFIFRQGDRTLELYVFPTPKVEIFTESDVICEDSVTLVVIPLPDTIIRKIKIGDILCFGGTVEAPENFAASGKIAMGVIFWISADREYSWVASLTIETEVWGRGVGIDSLIRDIPTVSGWCWPSIDTAGFQNTRAMRNAGNATIFPLAHRADFANGWYIPTITQMLTMYAVIPLINNSFNVAGGMPFPTHLNGMNREWFFWASAQHNSQEAVVIGYDGSVYMTPKNQTWNLRQIRYFRLPNE